MFKDLYLLNTSKYIVQKDNGTYATINAPLTDELIQKHLEGRITLGIFAGKVFTKFICFDVDDGKKALKRLLETLKGIGFQEDEYLVSLSGSKGYHVELFYEDPIEIDKAKQFYEYVLSLAGLTKRQVEFRPTNGQAVKLPLSYHKGTQKHCSLISPKTFKRRSERFLERLKRIKHDDSWKLEEVEVIEGINFDIPVDYHERCEKMLQRKSILYEGSRHNSTLLLLTYLHKQGIPREENKSIVKEVVAASQHLYKSPLSHALSEVDRLYKYAKQYEFDLSKTKTIRLYKTEIEYILAQYSSDKERLLILSLLVHSKKWANAKQHFYMSYKQMAEMGNDSNASRLLSMIRTFKEIEVIEHKKMLPNVYKIDIREQTGEYVDIETINKVVFKNIISSLFSRQDLKRYYNVSQLRKFSK